MWYFIRDNFLYIIGNNSILNLIVSLRKKVKVVCVLLAEIEWSQLLEMVVSYGTLIDLGILQR